MALINSDVIPASATGGYTIDQSLRFNDDDSPYLNRTPSSSGNLNTFTLSFWVKRSSLGTSQFIYSSGVVNANGHLFFNTSDKLYIMAFNSSGANGSVVTDMLFRDVGSWYHIVISFNNVSYSTRTDDITVYVNGEEVSITGANYNTPTDVVRFNDATVKTIGESNEGGNHFDGYLSEFHFIDGQALDQTSFGETGDYGEWKPIEYTGTYGTNGFYLDFGGTYYNDKSGNGNNFSATNLATTDVMLDSPTNNFATLNPLRKTGTFTATNFQQGNLYAYIYSSGNYPDIMSTITMPEGSGKYYCEAHYKPFTESGANARFGIRNADKYENPVGYNSGYYDYEWYIINESGDSKKRNNDTSTSYGTWFEDASVATEIVGIAYDSDNGKVWFHKNGTWQGDPSAGTGEAFSGITGNIAFSFTDSWNGSYHRINFGQDSSFQGQETAQGNTDDNNIGDFYYTPPTGFLALCTANLPDPAVIPSEHFNTVLYTGTGNSQSITGVGFQPDMNWIKNRGDSCKHQIHDIVTGVTAGCLYPNTTEALDTPYGFTSFDSDGFTTHASNAGCQSNSGGSYVSWNWKANGSGVSNTNGSITSTVSANQDAGFSIVGYTGDGSSSASIGHGLSSAPELVIYKNRIDVNNWLVLSTAPGTHSYAYLNLTNHFGTAGQTAPSSTLLYPGNSGIANGSGDSIIAYCFHSVPGYSKIGSYIGNGNADGAFIYTGFRPAYVMIKYASDPSSTGWLIYDTARDTYNPLNRLLYANSSEADNNIGAIDYLSNGFKYRNDWGAYNDSGDTYIYMAFAEQPFKYTNAR